VMRCGQTFGESTFSARCVPTRSDIGGSAADLCRAC
jgi:hypothetical protein